MHRARVSLDCFARSAHLLRHGVIAVKSFGVLQDTRQGHRFIKHTPEEIIVVVVTIVPSEGPNHGT